MKCSEDLSNMVSNIIRRYIGDIKCAAFTILYIWLYVLYAFV